MIEASYSAAPALLPVFLVLGVVFTAATAWWARRRGAAVPSAVLWGLSLAGEVAVTLTPTSSADTGQALCRVGSVVWTEVTGPQGLMNVALYVPLAYFGVLLFRRPATVLAGSVLLSATTEVVQTLLGTGRACDGTDFVDNAAGALLGTVLAVGWLLVRRSGLPRVRRDLVHGLVLATVGLAGVGLVVHFGVRTYRDASVFAAPPSDDLVTARRVAEGLFGPGTLVDTTTTDADPGPAPRVMEVTTDRGSFRIEQPGGRLLAATAAASAGADVPGLPPERLVAAGTAFAGTWFADRTAGLTPTVTPAGPDGRSRTLGYHRDDAAAGRPPVHVELTVAPDGRIVTATSS
ncbi:VanZ family protein [Kitasatospora sp. NPDC036755]|uniref:VanZ family protein n=1 Tax=Kitasatospora sp. NPDC036755 TaxID=3154600 RepID=UPI0033CEFA72